MNFGAIPTRGRNQIKMKKYIINWIYLHKKPKGAVTRGSVEHKAENAAHARKLHKKQYPHHQIESSEEI